MLERRSDRRSHLIICMACSKFCHRPHMYDSRLQRDLAGAVWGGCISWYNLQGQKNITMWPWTVVQYWWATRKVDWKAYDKSNAVAAKQA